MSGNLNLFPAISEPDLLAIGEQPLEKYQKIKYACCVVRVCMTLYPLEFCA